MHQDKYHYDNLNFVRVFLAILVTWSHCYPLTGSTEPISSIVSTETGGAIAVKAFFFISGFLVTISWIRSQNPIEFIAARVLRIIPALAIAIMLTIFLAFISSNLSGDLFFPAALDYFVKNITLFSGVMYELPGAYANQATSSVNGSLWTLPWEVRAYLALLIIGVLGIFRLKLIASFVLISLAGILFLSEAKIFYDNQEVPFMLLSFLMGSYIGLNINKVKLEHIIVIFFAAGLLLIYFDQIHFAILSLIFSSIILSGFTKHIALLKLKNDPSFGIYVYSFPIQQLIVFFFSEIQPIILFIFTLVIVYPISIASWILIEKPALKNRGKVMSFFNLNPRLKRISVVIFLFLGVFLIASSYKKLNFDLTNDKNTKKEIYWGIYFPDKNTLSLRKDLTAGFSDLEIPIAQKNVIPILGKWDGEKISLATFNKETCIFTFYNDLTTHKKQYEKLFLCTSPQAQPIAGDWFGDGKLRAGIYFSDSGLVRLENSNNEYIEFLFGMPNSNLKAISGDWDSNGISTIALWNPEKRQFDFLNKNESSVAELSFRVSSSLGASENEPFSIKNTDGTYSVGIYNRISGTFHFLSLKDGSELYTIEYGEKKSSGFPIFLSY